MTETVHVDPHSPDVDKLMQRIAEGLRDAPEGASLNINRDTAQAMVGAYKLAVSALDDLVDALSHYRHGLTLGDPTYGDARRLLDVVLDEHGIQIDWAAQ